MPNRRGQPVEKHVGHVFNVPNPEENRHVGNVPHFFNGLLEIPKPPVSDSLKLLPPATLNATDILPGVVKLETKALIWRRQTSGHIARLVKFGQV